MSKKKRELPAEYIAKTLKDDYRFGKVLIEKGYITKAYFRNAIDSQKHILRSGKLVRLANILIKKDMITYEHAEEAFAEIGEPRLFCRTCGNRYRANTKKRFCSRCNSQILTDKTAVFEIIDIVESGRKSQQETAIGGKRFGKFAIHEQLGQGGMGIVYRGYDTENDHPVALKILLPSLIKYELFRKRFMVEAAALKKIEHPNAVRFYEVGKIDDYLYCSMELLVGRDFSTRMRADGPVPFADVISVLWHIAGVLDYGYSKFMPGAFVHRDIKPHNIFECEDGSIRLMDFGLVRSRVLFGKSITEEGKVFGTVPYMSPEQIRGDKSIDIRSDIFSLGSTAYHLLSGEFPFQGEHTKEIKKEVLRADPKPIRKVVQELPKELTRILGKMMKAKPDNRYQTPRELMDAIEPLMSE
ncbi:MAG: serine/threonine protein kinase [Planctomycetota bacterium]|jgi:serine/threonine protein kinase